MKKIPVAASLALVAACCSLFFADCKKSDNTNTKSTLLKIAAWKYKDAGLDIDNNGTTDSPLPSGTLQACDIDNTLTFKTDTTGLVDEGATKCTATNPQSAIFTYKYNTSSNVITFSTAVFAGISGDTKVLELTATQMRLSQAVTVTGIPTPLTVIVTLVH